MNPKAQAVAPVQPLAPWRPERRPDSDIPLMRDLARQAVGRQPGAQSGPSAPALVGRLVELSLERLLEAIARGGAPPDGPPLEKLLASVRQAALRGLPLPALVLEGGSEGRQRVAVLGLRIEIALPGDPVAGEMLTLRLGAAQPPPANAAAAALSAAAAPAGAELGSAAQFLTRLLAAVGSTPPMTAMAALAAHAPLAANAGDAGQLAAGLREMLRSSGLFYESHLADWIAGKASKAELLREPQAGLPASQAEKPAAASAPGEGLRLAPLAEQLVQRQLNVLERRETHWQLQVWPGQEAELRIDREDQQRQNTGAEPAWRTDLRVTFPGLGQVDARIVLRGQQAGIALRAADAEGARALQAGGGELARALGEHGVAIDGLKVSHARSR